MSILPTGCIAHAAAPVSGASGDDFDDAGSTAIGLTTRPASGTKPGVTYGWDWLVVDPTGSITGDCIWLDAGRTGIYLDVNTIGGRPHLLWLRDEDMTSSCYVQAVARDVLSTADEYALVLGASRTAATGAVLLARLSGGGSGIQLRQYPAETGGADLIQAEQGVPNGVIRAELVGQNWTFWPDYVGAPGTSFTGVLPYTRGGNYCGLTVRANNGTTGPVVYDDWEAGPL